VSAIQGDERRGCTSASNASWDKLCPGRHLAQQGLPEETTEDAALGRRIHAALAKQDSSGLNLEETETFDRCRLVEARVLEQWFGVDAPKATAWREVEGSANARLWVKFPGPAHMLEHSCRPDCFWRLNDRALIIEYKTLAGDVPEVSRNLQLRDQQVLIRGKYMIPGDIATVVIQPLVTMKPELCSYSAQDSLRARAEMFARVAASNDPKSTRVPGEAQCKFCRARGSCVEYQRFAAVMIPNMPPLLEVAVSSWTPEQCAVFLDRRAIALRWLTEAEDAIKLRLKNGQAIPGWTLKPGYEKKTIVDLAAAFERFTALGGNQQQFIAACSVGKDKLRQQVHDVTGAKGKALDGLMDKLQEGITECRPTASTLQRVEDKP